MNVETIRKRLQILQDLSDELNLLKDQLDDVLENNKDYQKVTEEETQAKLKFKEEKTRIVENSSSAKAVAEQLKEKRTEIKENKEILSQELVDYYKTEDTLEFVDHNGYTKKMKFSVKLVS